jgi:hypothetical protein
MVKHAKKSTPSAIDVCDILWVYELGSCSELLIVSDAEWYCTTVKAKDLALQLLLVHVRRNVVWWQFVEKAEIVRKHRDEIPRNCPSLRRQEQRPAMIYRCCCHQAIDTRCRAMRRECSSPKDLAV